MSKLIIVLAAMFVAISCGGESTTSSELRQKTQAHSTAEWAAGVFYAIDDRAIFQGTEYETRQAHTSQVGWEPPNVIALWQIPKPEEDFTDWRVQTHYVSGSKVVHVNEGWECILEHVALPTWEPQNQPALWKSVELPDMPGELIWKITYNFEDPPMPPSLLETGFIPQDLAIDVTVPPNDDVVVVGGSLIQGSGITNQRGQVKAFDSAGVERWTITPASSGLMRSIDADSAGNMWIGGFFAVAGTGDTPLFGILKKIDGDGNTLWPPDEPGFNPLDMRVDSILVDPNDDVIALFRFANGQSRIHKRASDGTFLWEVDVPVTDTPFVEVGKLAIVTDDNQLFILLMPQSDDGNGAFVGEFLRSNGNLQQSFRPNDAGYVFRGIASKAEGELFLAGRKPGIVATSAAFIRGVTFENGNDVAIDFEETIEGVFGTGGEGYFDLALNPNGDIFAVGDLRDQSTATKRDNGGSFIWEFFNDVSGGQRGRGLAIAVDSLGNAVAVGRVEDQLANTLGYAEKHDP